MKSTRRVKNLFFILLTISLLGCLKIVDKNQAGGGSQPPSQPLTDPHDQAQNPSISTNSDSASGSNSASGKSQMRYQIPELRIEQTVELTEELLLQWGAQRKIENKKYIYELSIERLIFERLSVLLTNGFSLRFFVNEIQAHPDSKIMTFPYAQKASASQKGRDGGLLEINAEKAVGQIQFELRGEHGGDGLTGADPAESMRGLRGATGKSGHLVMGKICGLVACSREPICGTPRTFGYPGQVGLKGYQGGAGGRGGNSVQLKLSINKSIQFTYKIVENSFGQGGAGGVGGLGGLSGPQGYPGGVDNLAEFHLDSIEQVGQCVMTFPDNLTSVSYQIPDRGPVGDPGPAGEPGKLTEPEIILK